MTYLRTDLPPTLAFIVCICIFGRLIWVYPPPFPDTALLLSTYFCIQWAYARNSTSQS